MKIMKITNTVQGTIIKERVISARDITFASQATHPVTGQPDDIVACIHLGYDNRTSRYVNVHVYRFHSAGTASIFVQLLNQIINLYIDRTIQIERQLIQQGEFEVPQDNLGSSSKFFDQTSTTIGVVEPPPDYESDYESNCDVARSSSSLQSGSVCVNVNESSEESWRNACEVLQQSADAAVDIKVLAKGTPSSALRKDLNSGRESAVPLEAINLQRLNVNRNSNVNEGREESWRNACEELQQSADAGIDIKVLAKGTPSSALREDLNAGRESAVSIEEINVQRLNVNRNSNVSEGREENWRKACEVVQQTADVTDAALDICDYVWQIIECIINC